MKLPRPFTGSLWGNSDFLAVWVGETISVFGSQLTFVALPLLAALRLHASPTQMGLLGAAGLSPWLFFGLVAGVWTDRLPRRHILIAADIARALLLGSIPAAALFGRLSIAQLLAVGFLSGTLSVFFGVAGQPFILSIVPREDLVPANSAFWTSFSLSMIAGPGLAGMMVQFLSAPVAIAIDAITYVVSALLILRVHAPEPAAPSGEERQGMWREMWDGVRYTLGHPLLRASVMSSTTGNIFWAILGAVYLLYVTRELHMPPGLYGLIFTVGASGALLATLCSPWIVRRIGLGPAILWGIIGAALAGLLIPLAARPVILAFGVLVIAELGTRFSVVVFDLNRGTMAQLITPERRLGRVTASSSFIFTGIRPVGMLIGGALGAKLGLHTTLVIGVLGVLLAPLWSLFSPLRTLRDLPNSGEDADTTRNAG
jgi:MFS family permease